jgi:2-polyprenyl-3-methyl-5-hydroxy-6-metoxy-1,4-benzoquinol methylase
MIPIIHVNPPLPTDVASATSDGSTYIAGQLGHPIEKLVAGSGQRQHNARVTLASHKGDDLNGASRLPMLRRGHNMSVRDVLRSIALKYPQDLMAAQLSDVERIAFHIQLVLHRKGATARVCDIGGGIGMFTLGCAAMGMKAILVDDFRDEVNLTVGESLLQLHRSYGVDVISKDVVTQELDLPTASMDAITCFESMEHWHHSPKKLLRQLRATLKPQGLFVLSAPNCVDLKRRITVPFGHGEWSTMESWYESSTFRGHVREPDVRDLRYIGADMGLTNVEIHGRNWWARSSSAKAPLRVAAIAIDHMLRVRPSLCSSIYLLGSARD